MKVILKTTIAFSALLLSVTTFADKKALSAADAQTYKVDAKESTLSWTGRKKLGSSHTGAISLKEGQIEMKKGEISSGMFKIDMATLTNQDLASSPTDQKKLEGHLKSPDFFNAGKYPDATFKISKVEKKSDKEVLVKGELTMIGVTKPLEFPATITTENNTVKGEASVKIDRTKWGLKYGSGDFFKELTADKIISNEFELNLKLVAKK